MTYFAAGRLPGTQLHQFDPGLQTEADIQANIFDELEAGAVRYIVSNSEWNDVSEANDSSKSSHVFLLDDYIRAHYRKVRDFGSLQILIRSGAKRLSDGFLERFPKRRNREGIPKRGKFGGHKPYALAELEDKVRALDDFPPNECLNYLRNAGYGSA